MTADRGGSTLNTAGGSSAGFPSDDAPPAPAAAASTSPPPAASTAASGSTRPVVALGSAATGTAAVLRPLPADGVSLGPGFWRDRIDVNASRSLAAGLEQLEAAGTLENLRLAAGTAHGGYHGKLPFLDTDVFKWLEAVSWHLQGSPSSPWSARADEVIAVVAAAQEPDGYLNSYVQVVRGGQRWADLPSGHEMYCAGHLIQAGIAHHRATGRDTLFGVARRFADLLVAEFGEGGRRTGYCGHPEVETALVELYRETGERAYLDLAQRLVSLRGSGLLGDRPFGRRYFQDAQPVRESRALHGHTVRAFYLAAGVADLYLETGEPALLDVLRAQWSDLLRGKLFVTGGAGSRHRDEALGDAFELPPDRAYTETCAAVALLQWAWRMLLATGEAQFADVFERVLYNGFLAGVALAGDRFFYVNPLQVRPDSTLGPAGRQEWFSCACCPPNVMRTLASFTHYAATCDDAGLQIHQYVPGRIRAAGATAMGIDIATDYPYAGTIQIRIPAECAGDWTLALRIPLWSRGLARLRVDGADTPLPLGETGYARLARSWRGGELLELELAVDPRLTVADSRVDAVRGCVAVERGPLVYCAEQQDQPASLDDVRLSGTVRDGEPVAIGGTAVPSILLDAEVEPARVEAASSTGLWPYSTYDAAAEPAPVFPEQVTVTAIPYFAWANRDYGAMRVWLPVSG